MVEPPRDAAKLTRALLTSVFQLIDTMTVGRAACVSKLWSSAASTAMQSPRHQFAIEFGPDCRAYVEHLGGSPVNIPWADILAHCKDALPSLAHEQHEARCYHFLRLVAKGWRLRAWPAGRQAVFYSPVLVLPLPQSLWLRFTLPIELVSADGGETLLRNKMDLSVSALCSKSEPVLLDVKGWRMPLNDTERFLDSHRTGVYAWRAGRNEGTCRMAQGDVAAGDVVLHMAVYIHFEQLLARPSPLGIRDSQLPQRLPLLTARSSLSSKTPDAAGLEVVVDFCKLCRQGRLGGLRARLLPDWSEQDVLDGGISHLSWSLAPPSLAVFNLAEKPHHQNRTVKSFLEEKGCGLEPTDARGSSASCRLAMENLCNTEALVDFSIYDQSGTLLIGRSGVEMWESETDVVGPAVHNPQVPVVVSWRANFLVDQVDNSMWDNKLELKPQDAIEAHRVRLLLTAEAWRMMSRSRRG